MGPVRNPVLEHRVAPCFPWFLSFGIEPKTPGWLVQSPTTSPSGDLIPTIKGSGAHPGQGKVEDMLRERLGPVRNPVSLL